MGTSSEWNVTLEYKMSQHIPKPLILVTILLMDFLAGMEMDLFVPSFPELQQHFHLSPFWVEALLSVNFIGYCVSLFVVGSLADRYGRKPIILLGLLIFIGGSLLCVWGTVYPLILMGRLFQGVGVAAPSILSFLIIADTYPIKKQQSLFAILNGIMNLALAASPVLGSYIALHFHWRGNFMSLLLFGLVSFVMTLFCIPAYKKPDTKEPISIRGYLLLLQSKPLVLFIIHTVCSCTPYWIFVGMSPLLYMEGLGVSLSHFGYYQGALAFVFALGSLFFGMKIAQYESRRMLKITGYIFTWGFMSVGAATFFDSQSPLLIMLSLLPFVIGQLIPSIILYPICLNFMPHAKGRVSAILQGGRLILTTLSLQIAGYFYRGSFQNIGMIILIFIFLAIVTLMMVIRNKELMSTSPKK